jgi:hypothetical protein
MKEKVHYLWELILTGAILLNTTCQDEEINKIFPKEKKLTAKEIPINEIIDLERSTFVVVDDYFVITSPRTDTVIYIYSLPDFHFVKCFGELVMKRYKLSGIPYGIRNLTVINDSILFYVDDIPMKIALKSFDLKLGKMINSRKIKVKEHHEIEIEYSTLGILSANEHTLSYSYMYQNRIDFMHHNFSIKKIIKGVQEAISINPSNLRDSKIFYTCSYAGKEKLYFLYWGFSPNENNKQCIEVYDREGNPLIKYKLDVSVYFFTVDEKNNRIYGHSDNEDNIFMYDLN